MNSPIISALELNNILSHEDLIILDASQKGKTAMDAKYDELQIKGARYFDIKNVFSNQNSTFPNTFPRKVQFENECQKLGINQDSRIVVYDRMGIFSSPRVWWMFKSFGHHNIQVLNGGFPDWITNDFITEEIGPLDFPVGNFSADLDHSVVKDIDFIQSNIQSNESLVLDARSSGRFNGTAPEPRKGLRSGSIPNSINLPFTEVLKDGKFRNEQELIQLFSKLSIEDKPIVFSCGSGITACIILLAAEIASVNQKSVYDGSWTEWASLVKN